MRKEKNVGRRLLTYGIQNFLMNIIIHFLQTSQSEITAKLTYFSQVEVKEITLWHCNSEQTLTRNVVQILCGVPMVK